MQADGEAQFSFAAWIREMSTRRRGQLLVTLSLSVLISVSYAIHAARLRDPGYAAVYAAIALDYANECWVMDDRKNPKCDMAINFAQEGLELDPGMADAWAVLAMVRALRYEWAAAQDAVDRFNALPSPDIVSTALPTRYFALGQLQNAWDAVMTFYRNDPLNPEATHFAGAWLILDRWLEEGQVRPAQYWWMLDYTNRVDDFIDLSFQLFDEQTLNTG